MVLIQSPDNGDLDSAGFPSEIPRFSEDLDSACSTPYVSAPSSPGRCQPSGYFFSAPASPVHFMLSSSPRATRTPADYVAAERTEAFSSEFEFSSRFSERGLVAVGSMSSADELFLNGKIKPMKLSSHLQRPQKLAPLTDFEVEEAEIEDGNRDVSKVNEESVKRGRDLKLRSGSLRRKARSLSPLRNADLQWREEDRSSEQRTMERDSCDDETKEKAEVQSDETTPSSSASSSRSSSSGRNSKKWIFLKELLYRSKSEGRENGKEKFWSSINFSASKEKKLAISKEEKHLSVGDDATETQKRNQKQKQKQKEIKETSVKKTPATGKPANGVGKRRVPQSAHELHYTANRAQAEEMKKRTYLPYRQGLFGCLGFTSKGYGALKGLAKTLNPVSSR